jgi:glutamate racemase
VEKGTLVAGLRQQSFSLPIHAVACPELAPLIESGQWTDALRYIQDHPLAFFKEHPVDTIVYGCTHYPFIEPWLQSTGIHYAPRLDPAEAVAVAVARRVRAKQKECSDPAYSIAPRAITFYHTGDMHEGRARLAYHWPSAVSSQHIALPIM